MSSELRQDADFQKRWALVFSAARDAGNIFSPDFARDCDPSLRDEQEFKKAYRAEYVRRRNALETECYSGNEGGNILDARKMAAVVCCSMIEQKAYAFNQDAALALLEKRRSARNSKDIQGRLDYNRWIVNNFFVNYKAAFLAGLYVVQAALLKDLTKTKTGLDHGGDVLLDHKSLYRYPPEPDMDSFEVNMVLGLGRADVNQRRIDVFLLAMQYYQVEMYTRRSLELALSQADGKGAETSPE